MATHVRSLTSEARRSKANSKNNVAKPPAPKSLTGKRRQKDDARREEVSLQKASQKKSVIKALKHALAPAPKREAKVSFAAHLFAGMTPRQVKRLKANPTRMSDFLKSRESVQPVETGVIETVE